MTFLSFLGAARSHVTPLSCIPVEYNRVDVEAPWQATERAPIKNTGMHMERQFEFTEKLIKMKSPEEGDEDIPLSGIMEAQWG